MGGGGENGGRGKRGADVLHQPVGYKVTGCEGGKRRRRGRGEEVREHGKPFPAGVDFGVEGTVGVRTGEVKVEGETDIWEE